MKPSLAVQTFVRVRLARLIGSLGLTFLITGSAGAATIIANGVTCTLVDAITAANTNSPAGGCPAGDDASAGGDIIELTADVVLTVPNNEDANGCQNGLPAVTSRIRINGNNHTIARAGASNVRPFFRLLDSSTGDLTLNRVTVTNGFLESCDGAGINGTVTLIDSTISGNRIFGGNGGGINGTAILMNSTVSGNRTEIGIGGGINGTSTLMNSTVSGNCAGCGPFNSTNAVMNSLLANALPNPGSGGGIAGTVTLINSVVSGNLAGCARLCGGGGLVIDGSATIINSTISGNNASADGGVGGGIYLFRGTATLTNSTVSGNTSYGGQCCGQGGGIFSGGSFNGFSGVGPGGAVTLIHSTVSGNRSTDNWYVPGGNNADNGKGGGIFGDDLTLIDSIVADNLASNPIDGDCRSTGVQFKGLNLIGDGSCAAASYGQLTGDPLLGPLANNGGPTPTQALLPGSPALDQIAYTAGQGCGPTTVTADQRGVTRPQPAGGNCDIGAFESCTGVTITSLAATPNPTLVNSQMTLTAVADATTCGSDTVGGAAYSIEGVGPFPMFAADGAFDGASEVVEANVPSPGAPSLGVGVYKVCVSGTDAAGNKGVEKCLFLAIYDPAGGTVTGEGRIHSPAGAYAPDPSLSGKAEFSFASKYQKGATTPTGDTKFRFKAGDVDFRSTDYEWLVVTGAKAVLKGVGTINGAGNYGFMVSAIDGGLVSKPNVDKFRMKIWDEDSGALVYDNQLGSDDNADPSTAIAGGSIIIHKSK